MRNVAAMVVLSCVEAYARADILPPLLWPAVTWVVESMLLRRGWQLDVKGEGGAWRQCSCR